MTPPPFEKGGRKLSRLGSAVGVRSDVILGSAVGVRSDVTLGSAVDVYSLSSLAHLSNGGRLCARFAPHLQPMYT